MVHDVRQLDDRVSEILSCAWASSTLSCRNSQWKKFIKFCADRNLVAIPSELSTIVRFLAYLESKGYAFVTINNYLSGIIVLHKFYGVFSDFRASFLVQTVLAGLKRRLGSRSTPRIPLSVDQLIQIFRIYPRSAFNDVCWLAVIICFRTLLRKSNVVSDSSSDHVLLREDIQFFEDKVVFRMRTSKTRNKGEDVFEIPVMRCSNYGFCVYTQLWNHVNHYPAPQSSPLLLKCSRSGLVPLMYKDVLFFLKNCVKLLGLSADRVGLHSLRRSGAMFLQKIGIPLYEIQLLGDWKSMAVMLYLASTFTRKVEIQSVVVQELDLAV